MPAAIAIAAGIAVVAAGTALAAPVSKNQGSQAGTATPPPVTVQPVALQPAPSGSPTPSPSPSSSPGVPTPGIANTVTTPFTQSGDAFVEYQNATEASAHISGEITNAVSGELVKLYAQQFPFTSAPAPVGSVGSVALSPTGSTAQYSFQATPALATRYTVEVFQSSTATTPLASEAVGTVYVVMNQPGESTTSCTGSQCQSTETVTVYVPASALSAQMSEPIDTYFAIAYSSSGAGPPQPETLQMGAGDPTVSTPQQVSADEYRITLTFSYSSNGESYHSAWRHCTKSLEAQDGIGLPGAGSNGCGSQTIQDSMTYIG